ncbi:stage II sporulation protein P [Alkalihalobacillus sp. LMS39]|uniref:stage II sporulation protein P n=1 Tax=Alkalihalobacillus sp. LMS39 TaxID=2924032 RepID=UPI001FB1EEB0|nr:stage II sporulation protein P [Alkalihalobacillus sp. LMS39]UOE95636.1 stage II sporulation protein P [Alkalihalobacillus sp. LMS39]
MRSNQYRGFTFSVNGTSIRKLIVLTIVGMISVFILTGIITSLDSKHGLASSTIHQWAGQIDGESLVHVLGMENSYFTQVLPEDSTLPNVGSLAFELMTSINPDDPRSLLGRELPGFALFDGHIVVAGDGTNFTTMPIESAPPLEVLMEERQASLRSLEELENLQPLPAGNAEQTTGERRVVHVMHSHNRESFWPELEEGASSAFHSEVNITLVGKRFGQALERHGIGAEVDDTDVGSVLSERGWQYGKSYDAGREIVKEATAANEHLEFFFEFHRDTQPREKTTVTINGEQYARTLFVIGKGNKNYEQNLAIAEELHDLLEEHYPGLSRGIFFPPSAGTNGVYNQDLSPQSLLLEVGGVDNNLEEAFRSADAFAEVFSQYYWNAEKVSEE